MGSAVETGAARKLGTDSDEPESLATQRSKHKRISLIAFAVTFLLAESTGARLLAPSDPTTLTTDGGGSVAVAMAFASVLITVVVLIAGGQLQATFLAIKSDVPMMTWMGLAVLGALVAGFSTDLSTPNALIGAFRLTSAALIAFGCLGSLGLRNTLLTVWSASISISVASIVLYLVAPDLAYNGPLKDVFAGVLNWNSAIGFSAGLSFLLTLILREEINVRWPRGVWILALAAAATVLALSASRTAQFATALAIAAFCAEKVLPRRSRLGIYALVGAVSLAAVPTFADTVLGLAGKDLSFSGRTEVWAEATRGIAARPMTGWGMGNYWRITAPIIEGRVSAIDNAHNGYLEVILGAGILSVLPIAALVGRIASHTFVTRATTESAKPLLLGPLAVLVLSVNMTLSLAGRNGILPTLFLILAAPAWLLDDDASAASDG